MRRNRFLGEDKVAHTRKDYDATKKRGMPKGTNYRLQEPQELIDICLNCDKPTCHPTSCKRIEQVCKNCEHLVFSDCYGECGIGVKGIVKPYDSCKEFKKRIK